MNERGGGSKIALRLSAADIAAAAPDVRGHTAFFPADAFDPTAERPRGKPFQLALDGTEFVVSAVLAREGGVGAPVRLCADDAFLAWWGRRAFKPGDVLTLERVRGRLYRASAGHASTAGAFREAPPAPAGAPRAAAAVVSAAVADPAAPTMLDLFAGCGGAALGFRAAGFRIAQAIDHDADAAATYRRNLGVPVVEADLAVCGEFPDVDVVVAGPPSEGLNALGEHGAARKSNTFTEEFLRVVTSVRPPVFVYENVAPLLRSPEYETLCETARLLGYGVEGRVLNAADYGVPQTRKRAVVIGVFGRKPSFPAATHVDPLLRDLTTLETPPWRNVRDAIGDLSHTPDGRDWHVARTPTPQSRERYAFIPPGGNRFDLPPRLLPECWKRRTEGGTDVFGRLWWDRPAVTIRTEFYKPEKGRYLHPAAHRAITPREAARLQGFPDDFKFEGTLTSVGRLIGSALPPPFAEALAVHVRAILAADPRRRERGAADRR